MYDTISLWMYFVCEDEATVYILKLCVRFKNIFRRESL